MKIRRAENKDTDAILKLLEEVHELHAKIRPDIFISGKTKYTKEELQKIFADEKTPVFVAEDEGGKVCGHAFTVMKSRSFTIMKDIRTLYIDDICVDNSCRGQNIGTLLFLKIKEYAKEQSCYNVTLNVWEGNDSARKFYEKMGMFIRATQMEIIL